MIWTKSRNLKFREAVNLSNHFIQNNEIEKIFTERAESWSNEKYIGYDKSGFTLKRPLTCRFNLLRLRRVCTRVAISERYLTPFSKDELIQCGKDFNFWLKSNDIEAKVYDFGRFSGALASVKSSQKDSFNVNSRTISRPIESLTGTIIHEVHHVFDNDYSHYYIGHITNQRAGNEETAPYWNGKHFKEQAKLLL
jgi:hypothetical protein